MPFIDPERFLRTDHGTTVQTPILWETQDRKHSGKIVVRGDGGLSIETGSDTQNAALIGKDAAKKLALTILQNQGFAVQLSPKEPDEGP